MFSRYERVTDRRTFKDRRDLWHLEKPKPEFVPERPKAKIKHVEVPKEDEFYARKKNKNLNKDTKSEEDPKTEETPVNDAEEILEEQQEENQEEQPEEIQGEE